MSYIAKILAIILLTNLLTHPSAAKDYASKCKKKSNNCNAFLQCCNKKCKGYTNIQKSCSYSSRKIRSAKCTCRSASGSVTFSKPLILVLCVTLLVSVKYNVIWRKSLDNLLGYHSFLWNETHKPEKTQCNDVSFQIQGQCIPTHELKDVSLQIQGHNSMPPFSPMETWAWTTYP